MSGGGGQEVGDLEDGASGGEVVGAGVVGAVDLVEMGLLAELFGVEVGLALDVDDEVEGTGEGGVLCALTPHIDDAVPPVDGLAGDRFSDGHYGHAIQDVVEARAHGDRGADHAGEYGAWASGLVPGFYGVEDVDDAGLIAGSGDVDINVHEGAGGGDDVTDVVGTDVKDVAGEVSGVGEVDVADRVSGEFKAHHAVET